MEGQRVRSLSNFFHHNKERNIAVPGCPQLNRPRPCVHTTLWVVLTTVRRYGLAVRPRALVFRQDREVQSEQESTAQDDKHQNWKDEIVASHCWRRKTVRSGTHEPILRGMRLCCQRRSSEKLWAGRRFDEAANLIDGSVRSHSPAVRTYSDGIANSGMGRAAKRRRHGRASQRAHCTDRETRALSVAMPVLAYICR